MKLGVDEASPSASQSAATLMRRYASTRRTRRNRRLVVIAMHHRVDGGVHGEPSDRAQVGLEVDEESGLVVERGEVEHWNAGAGGEVAQPGMERGAGSGVPAGVVHVEPGEREGDEQRERAVGCKGAQEQVEFFQAGASLNWRSKRSPTCCSPPALWPPSFAPRNRAQ